MEHIFFSNFFLFRSITLKNNRHTDNSKGIECHFIARMRKGRGIIRTISGEEIQLSEGEIFYLPNGLRYNSYWFVSEDGERTAEWESYGFRYLPDPAEKRYKMQKLAADGETASLLDKIREVMTVSPSTVGYLYLFLGKILPSMEELNTDVRAELWRNAVSYIKEHSAFKVSELAEVCNMSESGLYAFFREYGGISPVEMKHRIKAERAVNLLRFTDRSIEDISAELGFCSAAYFRKIIKKQTGKTPTRIRKEQARNGML